MTLQPTLSHLLPVAAVFASAVVLSACGSMASSNASMYSQANVPATVQVPAGHKVAMETVGVGSITYECRTKAGMPDSFEWVFVGPKAVLNDRSGQMVGRYFGPPATWEASDASQVTGTQVAVAPATAGSIPLQLVKANPAMGAGKMMGVSYIQRVATRGGVAPAAACSAANLGSQQVVAYQADYIFWTAG